MTRPTILDHAATLADPTRCRLLLLLEAHELTVSELCTITQLPQSTVSRHLKVLADGGWLRSRRDGTRHAYRMSADEMADAGGELWRLVRDQLAAEATTAQDRLRLTAVLAERRDRSRAFFSSTAGEWDRLRDELFGRSFDLFALLALLDPTWTLADLACGTGRVAAALAPAVGRVIAIDDSPQMLAAARRRLAELPGVEVREGRLEELPLADASLDAATLFLALHHVAEPHLVLAEARRVLRPGGRLLLVDMLPHDREEYRDEMGHSWLGFGADQIRQLLAAADFTQPRLWPLPADPEARGPALFVAAGTAADRES